MCTTPLSYHPAFPAMRQDEWAPFYAEMTASYDTPMGPPYGSSTFDTFVTYLEQKESAYIIFSGPTPVGLVAFDPSHLFPGRVTTTIMLSMNARGTGVNRQVQNDIWHAFSAAGIELAITVMAWNVRSIEAHRKAYDSPKEQWSVSHVEDGVEQMMVTFLPEKLTCFTEGCDRIKAFRLTPEASSVNVPYTVT